LPAIEKSYRISRSLSSTVMGIVFKRFAFGIGANSVLTEFMNHAMLVPLKGNVTVGSFVSSGESQTFNGFISHVLSVR
jgi:hypothetical protein